ncbi:hypothetical protein [Rhodoferax sp. PAMC 29310]|uniref:hypothetical protein n=1 Tax=Rhodoferax sp. PAMC 29310 TaxID=2822760 RepID=UPI001B33D9B2|nr:hypothetical protein [Rhodoferax sp. PAMC 29310]
MTPGPQFIKDQALKAAVQRLRLAAAFTKVNIKKPLFQKRMGKGESAVVVRFEWPGRLSVYDAMTGEELAASELGSPDVLHAEFVPYVPALQDKEPGRYSTGAR